MSLDGYKLRRPVVQLMYSDGQGRAQLEIAIHEGRNRQVRRMCAAAGMQVKKLVRVAEGRITLGQLECGKWRYLTDEELSLL